MGQHKTNPTAILAKEGKLPPKEKVTKMSKEELQQMVNEFMIKKYFGINKSYTNGDGDE